MPEFSDPDVDPTAQGTAGRSGNEREATAASKGDKGWRAAAKAGGKSLAQSGERMIQGAQESAAENMNRPVASFKRGGTVRKTGLARVHKGEYVVPRKKVKKVKRVMKTREI